MATGALTPTSYLVLGLLATQGPLTPYEMKQRVEGGVGFLWTFPHSQLYSEPERLQALGLVTERREEGGRRRRRFAVTAAGRKALRGWLQDPAAETTEIRDLALLKLYFAGMASPDDVRRLARAQHAAHEERLATYIALDEAFAGVPGDPHPLQTLQLGLAYERAAVAFWKSLTR
jgi:DNA-binding PadR family transcriptional regulator